MLGRPGGECVSEPLQVPHARTAQSLKPLLDRKVALVEEEDAAGRVAVAAGAPHLLEVPLQGPGRVIVDDVADVRLVDPEAEGARRHHDDACGTSS